MQTSFDVDFAALFQVLAGNLGQPLPQNDVVPLGSVLPLAGLVFIAFVGGQREFRHRCAGRGVFQFRVLPKIANQNDFINALTCHQCCSFRLGLEFEMEPPLATIGLKPGVWMSQGLDGEYIRSAEF